MIGGLRGRTRSPAGVSSPMLPINPEPCPPRDTAGHHLLNASELEFAELRRGGYTLFRDISRAS